MSLGIPKSVREALARQAAGGHPSPDLLNGYVEQSLTAGEREQVTTHLTACEGCRDVVFLASAVAEEDLIPARATTASHPPQLNAASLSPAPPPRAGAGKPASGWWSWKSAAPVAAGLALVFGFLAQQHWQPDVTVHPVQTARTQSPQPQDTPELLSRNEQASSSVQLRLDDGSKANLTTQQSPAGASERKSGRQPALVPEQQVAVVPAPSSRPPGAAQVAPKTTVSSAPLRGLEATSPPPLVSALEDAASPEAKTRAIGRTSFAGSNEAGTTLFNAPLATMRVHWRITSDGHLERSLLAGNWTRVLGDQPVAFRVVSVVGHDVWTGGSDGVLFHSLNNGADWSKVALTSGDTHEQGAITSIHFDTAQQGILTVDSGATWTTSDGGRTWAKQ